MTTGIYLLESSTTTFRINLSREILARNILSFDLGSGSNNSEKIIFFEKSINKLFAETRGMTHLILRTYLPAGTARAAIPQTKTQLHKENSSMADHRVDQG